MRLVIQRVSSASVEVDGQVRGKIEKGILILLGIHKKDVLALVEQAVDKVVNLRIFEDENGKMNRSLKEVGGEVLVVSQFTLYGNCSRGRRPDFLEAAKGEDAEPIYKKFVDALSLEVEKVQTGVFGALMQVSLINSGPVTLIIEM